MPAWSSALGSATALVLLLASGRVGASPEDAASSDPAPAPSSGSDLQATASDGPSAPAPRWLGVQLDAGVPDGATVAAIVRPLSWLRAHVGVSHNLVGFGLRGGVGVVPFDGWISPSLTVEGGHFFEADFRGFAASVIGAGEDGVPETLSYGYLNAHLGLELGSPDVTFFVRGGVSLIEASLGPSREALEIGVRFEEDARVTVLTPSAKLGLVVYVL